MTIAVMVALETRRVMWPTCRTAEPATRWVQR